VPRCRGHRRDGVTILVDLVYFLALITLGPFYWVWRRFKKKTGAPVSKRLGSGLEPRAGDGPLVWIHAVSVGEVTAVAGLVARLRELRPDLKFLVTTTTTSGLKVARQTFPADEVRESPLDFSFAVRRYFDAFRPGALVLVEGELWPNLLALAGKRGVPVFVANARVSDRSFGRYRLLTRVWPGFLGPVRSFLVQSARDRDRLVAMNVGADRIAVCGNIKFDNARVEDPAPLREELRRVAGIPEEAPVVVAGSTHPGEEEAVVGAFRDVQKQFPTAVLVLAPRHLERLPEVRALLDGVGLETLRWSERSSGRSAPCVLVDTIGELGRLYAAADVAFIGGSLAPIGGHNLLEPARFGIPMLAGPHLQTVRTLASTFEQSGALTVVRDRDDLARKVNGDFSDRVGAAARGRKARDVIAENQGAARRCAEAVAQALRGSDTGTQSHD
jgi:3-deoxy-D-manno-octulosonic-acid transferase